jgi:regulator of sirC expression with transglutaminase-like and TPR domain
MRGLVFSLLLSSSLMASPQLSQLDPLSVSQHLAFYELYPNTSEGKEALQHAWDLLNRGKIDFKTPLPLPSFDIQAIISLVTRQPFSAPVTLSQEQLGAIETISSSLLNRKLKGYSVWTKKELLPLPSEEIDLSRGLLINQFNENQESIRQYEASLDLMALQILARLPGGATPNQQIQAINRFIFQEMRFRFPPHSLYAKDVDLYTFLPSVLDSREGVCLGISILYLALAQRIGLPLEVITPPGHIYVRYRHGLNVINIETTARGINLPSETYLGIDTRRLQQRTIKEVIGMAFVNQASVAWGLNDYETTTKLYEIAKDYLPDDPLLNFFLGLNYLFVGKKSEGRKLLEPLKGITFDYAVSCENVPEDYLTGKVDTEGLKAIFMRVDENRSSILEKQKRLQKTLSKYPKFREGLFHLAISFLQLGRPSQAKEVLEKYHKLDPTNCVVEYYLAILSCERFDYTKAWHYLNNTEELLKTREHTCKALRGLKDQLRRVSPN